MRQPELLWSDEIQDALESRNAFFEKIGIFEYPLPYEDLMHEKQSALYHNAAQATEDIHSPWYHFIQGVTRLRVSTSDTRDHFAEACGLASDNPGQVWALGLEFRAIGQKKWSERCFEHLEFLLRSTAAASAPVVSQQLLMEARQEQKSGNIQEALNLLAWSSRFTQYPFWQLYLQGWWQLMSQPRVFVSSIFGCSALLLSSWQLQTRFVFHAYQWIRALLKYFCFFVLCIALFRAIRPSLHHFTHVVPFAKHSKAAMWPLVLPYISLSAFGFVPFLLLTGLVTWRFLEGRIRVLVGIMLFFLAIYPLDARIRAATMRLMSPDSSTSLFCQVQSGTHLSPIAQKIQSLLERDPNDYLSHLALAIGSLKSDSLPVAQKHINLALRIRENDPVVLATAGDIQWAAGDTLSARGLYKKCVRMFPTFAQQHIEGTARQELLESNALLSEAAHVAQDSSSTEIPGLLSYPKDKNQLLTPDYNPGFFWFGVFPAFSGSWSDAAAIWDRQSPGVSLRIYSMLLPLFLITFFGLGRLVLFRQHPGQSVFSCKLCGIPICAACRADNVCASCRVVTNRVTNEAVRTNIEYQIASRTRRRHLTVVSLLNVLFPGIGDFADHSSPESGRAVKLLATLMVFTTYHMYLTTNFAHPFWVVKSTFIWLVSASAIYHVVYSWGPARTLVGLIFEKERARVA